jgi:hypothetical protein
VARRAERHGDVPVDARLPSSPPHCLSVVFSPSSPVTGTAPAGRGEGAGGLAGAWTRAWTVGFHHLTQDYLTRLTRLVDEYACNTFSVHLSRGGHLEECYTTTDSDAATQLLPLGLRGRGLGGNAEEDAALELDVDDLRRAERGILQELQARQQNRQRAEWGAARKSVLTSANIAVSSPLTMAAAAVGVPAASSKRTSSFPAHHNIGLPTTTIAASSTRTSRSSQAADSPAGHHTHTAGGTAPTWRGRRSWTAANTSDAAAATGEPPIPDDLLELFRHAQKLSPPTPASATNSPHHEETSTSVSTAALADKDDVEAAALARLCMKYFFTSKPAVPAPVTAPPPPSSSDRPWSPQKKRKSSRHDPLHVPTDDELYAQKQKQCRRGGGEKQTSHAPIDTFLFSPPHLHSNGPRPHHQQHHQPYFSRQGSPLLSSPPRASFSTPEPGSAAEGGIPMSFSGPAAWRKLIDKRTAAAAAAAAVAASTATSPAKRTSLPSVPSSIILRTVPAGTRAAVSDPVPRVQDEDFSFGFPPPRALLAATNTSQLLEALSKEECDGPLSRYLGTRLGLKKSAHVSATKGTGVEAVQDNPQRLPAVPLRNPPPPPSVTAAKTAEPAWLSSRPAASSQTHADQHGTAASSQRRLPPVTRLRSSGCTRRAPAAPSPASTVPVVAPKARPKKAKSRPSKTPLAPSVVLPPHYHGLHGEKLATPELEQLVKSVKQENHEAQTSLGRTYRAVNAAAATLYALQQSVAQVLLENVQLEKDIATLTSASPANPACEDGANEGQSANATQNTSSNNNSCSTSRPPATSLTVPPARRALFALPARAAPAASSFTNSLLLNTSAHGRRQLKGKKREHEADVQATKTTLVTSAELCNATLPDVLDRYYDPVAVLEELRAATAAQQFEHTRTQGAIATLTARITRHDALLQAVAEYWRRNAAVMKRQQFAVQSHPKVPSSAVVMWRSSGTTTRKRRQEGTQWTEREALSSSPLYSSSTRSGSSPSDRRSSSSSTNRTATSGTPSSRMPELLGSPSQLEQALAHMEAVSPMQPSSAVSFDLYPSPPRTTENSSAPPTMRVSKHATIRRKHREGDDGVHGNAAVHEPRLQHNHHHHHRSHVGRDPLRSSQRIDGHLSDNSLPSYATTTTTTPTNAGATTRTLFSSPEPALEEDELAKGGCAAAAVTDAPTKDGSEPVPSIDVIHEANVAGSATAASPAAPPSLVAESAGQFYDNQTVRVLDSRLAPNTTTSTIAGRREEGAEEEEVLQLGSWRTIPALQLEQVDEIAEFIYSVFERV